MIRLLRSSQADDGDLMPIIERSKLIEYCFDVVLLTAAPSEKSFSLVDNGFRDRFVYPRFYSPNSTRYANSVISDDGCSLRLVLFAIFSINYGIKSLLAPADTFFIAASRKKRTRFDRNVALALQHC